MLKDLFSKKKYVTMMLYKDDDNKIRTTTVDGSEKVPSDKARIPKPQAKQPIKGDNRMGARDRIDSIIDQGSFVEYDVGLHTKDILNFPDYTEKIEKAMENSKETEAVVTGEGKIAGEDCIICVMDSNFMMGSMGSVVGEKITRAIERAIEKRLPIIIFTASGGARMQEGIVSLMQMAKTSAALGRLNEEGLLCISVLTDPTTGGVTASFAMLGDIIIAEPNALIGFAGPRVIEQTIRQKLPEGFQRAEFLLEKGFVDKIVHRRNMKVVLSKILKIHTLGGGANA